MDKLNILVSESKGFSPLAAACIQNFGTVQLLDLDRAELLEEVQDADVLWVRLRHYIDGQILDRAGHLRVIATATTGLSHIDLQETSRRGIQVVSLRGEVEFLRNVRATAEHTIALMLAVLRNIPGAARHTESGRWDRDSFRGHELYEKNAGIVGYGRLGRIVARYLRAFGATVRFADPYIRASDVAPSDELVTLEELLAEADIVSLHADLRKENQGFFSKAQFDAMKPDAVFVNTARGELVDEAALLEALQSGRLGAAALDVLGDEQRTVGTKHPLMRYAAAHQNLLITPHIGGCTVESMSKAEGYLAERLGHVLRALKDRPAVSLSVS